LDQAPVPLPRGLEESSGLAPVGGEAEDSLVWTHNDSGGEARLFAVDLSGRVRDSLWVDVDPTDLEALERSRCADGWCIYLADVGDNEERRQDAVVYRFSEPARGAQRTTAVAFPVRFPHGPTDVEAMFVLPDERIHLVSKGRSRPITVYRYPLPLRPGERVTLDVVQTLTAEAPSLAEYVTGAGATTDGRLVAIRSYEGLDLYRVEADTLAPMPGGRVVLRSLREAQGEAVTFLSDDRVLLTSEAGPLGRRGGLVVLRCDRLRGSARFDEDQDPVPAGG